MMREGLMDDHPRQVDGWSFWKKAIVRQSQRCFNPLTDGWQNKNNSRYFYVDISRQPQIIQDNYQPMPLTGCWNFKKELKYVIWKHIFGQNTTHFQIWSILDTTSEVGSKIWVILKEASDGCSKMKCVCRPDGRSLLSVLAPSYHSPARLCPIVPALPCTSEYLYLPNVPRYTCMYSRFLYLVTSEPNSHVPSLTDNTCTVPTT